MLGRTSRELGAQAGQPGGDLGRAAPLDHAGLVAARDVGARQGEELVAVGPLRALRVHRAEGVGGRAGDPVGSGEEDRGVDRVGDQGGGGDPALPVAVGDQGDRRAVSRRRRSRGRSPARPRRRSPRRSIRRPGSCSWSRTPGSRDRWRCSIWPARCPGPRALDLRGRAGWDPGPRRCRRRRKVKARARPAPAVSAPASPSRTATAAAAARAPALRAGAEVDAGGAGGARVAVPRRVAVAPLGAASSRADSRLGAASTPEALIGRSRRRGSRSRAKGRKLLGAMRRSAGISRIGWLLTGRSAKLSD